jgi:hypothetical protein
MLCNIHAGTREHDAFGANDEADVAKQVRRRRVVQQLVTSQQNGSF